MKLTFVSNYINHHQIPLSSRLYDELSGDYHFIQVMPMEKERQDMGWGLSPEAIPYLLEFYKEPERCRQLIIDSDMVIFGGVEDESYIQPRLRAGKPVIRYSERLYREGQWKAISPRGLIKKYFDHTRYRNKNVYLLCAGAYTASDFSIIRAYPDKMYKWGYFTEFSEYDIDSLLEEKGFCPGEGAKKAEDQSGIVQPDGDCIEGVQPHGSHIEGVQPHGDHIEAVESDGGRIEGVQPDGDCPITERRRRTAEIVFAGRFIPLKHPEYAIELALHLKKEGIPFHITMVGDGELRTSLEESAARGGVAEHMDFVGFKPPKEVRFYMERADIFLMTSNHLEGWGAVISEAMNSGCVVIASSLIGAVPFLLRHDYNGLVYREGDLKEFLSYGRALALDTDMCRRIGRAAYYTIKREWNPDFAAKSLLRFVKGLLLDEPVINESGPLSPAPILFPGKGYAYVRE